MQLPTVEECRTFLDTINRGREAVGLEPLDTLAFRACEPAHPLNCLSARHLFMPAGYTTYVRVIRPELNADGALVTALNLPAATEEDNPGISGFRIPDEIKVVTDVFDAGDDDAELLARLHDRMVEAGVVA